MKKLRKRIRNGATLWLRFDPRSSGSPDLLNDHETEAETLRALSPQRMDGEPIYSLPVAGAPRYDDSTYEPHRRTCIIHGDDLEDRTVHVGRGAEILWCPSCGKRRTHWDVRDGDRRVVARGSVGVQSATTTKWWQEVR